MVKSKQELNWTRERLKVEEKLRKLQDQPALEIVRPRRSTLAAIPKTIRSASYNIFHSTPHQNQHTTLQSKHHHTHHHTRHSRYHSTSHSTPHSSTKNNHQKKNIIQLSFIIISCLLAVGIISFLGNHNITGLAVFEYMTQSDFQTNGTFVQTWYNTTAGGVALNLTGGYSSGNFTSNIINIGGAVVWNNISWASRNAELSNDRLNEIAEGTFGSLSINMTQNVLLLHFNNDSSYGENSSLVHDFSGYQNNGTVVANAHANLTAKQAGAASYTFDNESRDYITISDSLSLDLTRSTMGFSVWIQPNFDQTANTDAFIFDKTRANTDAYRLYYQGAIKDWTFQVFANALYDCDTVGVTFNPGEWHHLAGIFSDTESRMRMYWDGELSKSCTITGSSTLTETDDALLIGAGDYANNSDDFFDGNIDELALFNRSLSAAEVTVLYKRGLVRLNISVKSCDDSSCSGESFTQLRSESSPEELSIMNNKYFQYIFDFSTPDVSYTPVLYNVSIDYVPPRQPNITLNSPANNTFIGSSSILLNVTVTDPEEKNVTVYFNGDSILLNATANQSNGTKVTYNWTGLAEGYHNWTAFAGDGDLNSSTVIGNFTVDITYPAISFTTQTPDDGFITNRSWVAINISVVENNIKNITYYLYNSSYSLVNRSSFASNTTGYNFTALGDNLYYYNVTIEDLANHTNQTSTRNITIDTIVPAIGFISPTPGDSHFQSGTSFVINLSVIEVNLKNITYYLYSSTGSLLNRTSFADETYNLNFTGLSNGITYLYNVTIKDQVNQTNSTATRNITIDNVIPSINFTAPTIASGEIVNTSSIAINLTVVENNTKNVTYYLYDDSGSLLQRASFSNTTYFYNFTGLSNGIYRYNATIEDKVNFTNQTVTRNITLDTTSPAIIFSSLTMGDGSFQNSSNIFVDLDVVENNTDNVTFYLYNSTANVLNKTSFRNATYSFNFTGLSDEIMYFYNVTIIDKVNFTNQTLTRNITLDRTSPAISFTSPTPENNRVINTSYLPIKLSITDASIQNITYYLFNNTGVLLNKTSFLSNTTEFNFTSLSEGSTYYYNATIIDRVNFSNSTTTRNVTIDLTAPHVITLVDPTPVDGSAGDDDIIMNWTASDNMDVNISCFPVVDSAEQDQVGTLNGTYSSAALILTGGIHTLSVRCYDNANNSNRSAERTYIVGKMNITYPENNAIVRVNGSLTINTTILFGEEFINNITLFIDEGNETRNISTSNDSLTNYTGTYSVPNKSPRYLSVTAIGFNNSRGIGLNVSVNITLVLLRISNTTSSPANTYFCSNESYSLNGSSITLSVIHNLDTLLLETNMTVVLPNSSVKAVSHLANVTDINGSSDYLQKFNFTYTPESIGNYIFRSTVKDFENQTLQSNVTVHADNSRTVNWSGVQVSNMSLKDLCTNEAILSGHPLAGTIPNNSIYNLEATMSIQPEIINFTNANITGLTLGNIINLTRRTNETDPPSGQRRIFMFDVTTNMTFDNFTWLYNYSDIQYTLTTEENMNVYKCDDLSSCVFEKQTVTIDSSDNQVILEGSSLSRFIITEPALFGNSSSFDPPIIRLLNTTKTYLNPNETFDIAATFDAFFLIDTVTMTVNSTLLSAYNTTALNSTFHIYRYNHSLSNTGDYLIQVVVLDENTFSDTASLVVYIVDNTTVNLTSNGGNMINLFDIRNGNKLYNGTTIVQPVPEGRYNLSVVTNNSEIFLYNVSVNSSLHEVLFYQNLDGAISPPTNRKSRAQLEINTTLDYDTVTIVYNYTNITGSITDEDNLELYKCESAGNCTLTQLNITIDTNQNLVTTTINNLSVFILAESIATETTTTTVTVSAGGGGGGGSSKTVQKNVALEFIPTTALQLKINQSVTAKIMAINSGEVNFDKVDVSITSPTGNVNVFPIQKEITSLGPNETTSFDVFIDAITDPGIYEVVLTGASILPFYTETAKFSIEVLQDERIVNQTKIIERITFAKDLFKENPECIEFQEVIEQAGKALEQGELMKGSSLVESAINACKETITALNDVVPSRIIPEKFNILKIILVIMILTLVIWLSMEGLIRHKRRKKILQSLNISEGNAFDENGDLESNRQYSAGYKLEGSETNNTIGSDDKTLENKPQIEEKDIWEKPKE